MCRPHSAMRCTMERPSPEFPWALRSRRQKRWKIRLRSASEIPGPRSLTLTMPLSSTTNSTAVSLGVWRIAFSASTDVVADGVMYPFEHGSVIGFVRRVDGRPEAVSGICTHQGCRLWFDAGGEQLRCPCHSTSFSSNGQVLTYQLPSAPKPLPQLQVREVNGAVEIFAPTEPTEPT